MTELDSVIGKARNHIWRVGIELEGGWESLPRNTRLSHDGSVHINEHRPQHVGELPSPPMEVKAFPRWVREHYPSHVNQTCGLHIHMQPKTAYAYQVLMEPEYKDTVIRYLKLWAGREGLGASHAIWPRLAGENEYCQNAYFPHQQASARTKTGDRDFGHRYTIINYCHALHGTLECRVLPMFEDAELAVSAIREVLNITNAFLRTGARRDGKIIVRVQLRGRVREEIAECL